MPNTPQSLHSRLMSIVQRNIEAQKASTPNNVSPKATQPSQTPKPFIMSWGSYSLPISLALVHQLDRYCEANPVTLKYKKSSKYAERDGLTKQMPRSKVVRRAVYALMEELEQVSPNIVRSKTARRATSLPPNRNVAVSWTMPQNKRADTERFQTICRVAGIGPSAFARMAIYLYTEQYKSNDPTEHKEAMSDAWF